MVGNLAIFGCGTDMDAVLLSMGRLLVHSQIQHPRKRRIAALTLISVASGLVKVLRGLPAMVA